MIDIHFIGSKAFDIAKARLKKLSGGTIPSTNAPWTLADSIQANLGSSTGLTGTQAHVGARDCSIIYLQPINPTTPHHSLLSHLDPSENTVQGVDTFIRKKINELGPTNTEAVILAGRHGKRVNRNSQAISDTTFITLQEFNIPTSTVRLFDIDANTPHRQECHMLFERPLNNRTTMWVKTDVEEAGAWRTPIEAITEYSGYKKFFRNIQVALGHRMHFSDKVLTHKDLL
jgi:hypothetical protein